MEVSADWERTLLAAGGRPGAMTAGLAAALDKAYAERIASGFFDEETGTETVDNAAQLATPEISATFPELALSASAGVAASIAASLAQSSAVRASAVRYESCALAVAESAREAAGGSYSEYSIVQSGKAANPDSAAFVSATSVHERSIALGERASAVMTAAAMAQAASGQGNAALIAAQETRKGLSYWSQAEALLNAAGNTSRTGSQQNTPSDEHTLRQSWLSYGTTQDALLQGLMQRFLADKDAWLTSAEAALARPDTKAQFLGTDADTVARTYIAVVVPKKNLGQVTAEHREAESAKAPRTGQKSSASSEGYPPAEPPSAHRSTALTQISGNDNTPVQKPNLLQKALQFLKAIVQSEPMEKVESSNRGDTRAPQGTNSGMVNDAIDTIDAGSGNDTGTSVPTEIEKPDTKALKSKTNSKALLIDGEDTVEEVRDNKKTTQRAAVKEVEEPVQVPHEEGMKIADDGLPAVDTAYDFTAADLETQVAQKKAVAAQQSQERYDKEKAELEKKLEALRVEAAKAGMDVFEYYNREQNKLIAAQNNGRTSLETQVLAMKNTLALINKAKNYQALTKQESEKYVKTATKEINENLTISCEVVSLSNGNLRDQVGRLNEALLKRIQEQGSFAFSMLPDTGNAKITTNFAEAIEPTQLAGTDTWYEANRHTGIDVAKDDTSKPLDLVASLFVEVMSSDGSNVKMNVIGTDVRFQVSHLDNEVTEGIFAGQTYVPGDLITNYPKEVNGKSSGLHYHIDVTRAATEPNTGKEVRVFVNPHTLNVTDLSWMRFAYREGTKTMRVTKATRYTRKVKNQISYYHGYSDVPITGTTTSTMWCTDYDTKKVQGEVIQWYVNTNDENKRLTDDEGWIEYNPF